MTAKILENIETLRCWQCVQCSELKQTGWKAISGHDPMWYCPSCLYPYYWDMVAFTFPTANGKIDEQVMKEVVADRAPLRFSPENIAEQFRTKRYDFLLKYRGCIGYMTRYTTVDGIVVKGDDEPEKSDNADIVNN